MMTIEGEYICVLLNSVFMVFKNIKCRQRWQEIWDVKERNMGWQGNEDCHVWVRIEQLKGKDLK